jgi:hypothetical protein
MGLVFVAIGWQAIAQATRVRLNKNCAEAQANSPADHLRQAHRALTKPPLVLAILFLLAHHVR